MTFLALVSLTLLALAGAGRVGDWIDAKLDSRRDQAHRA